MALAPLVHAAELDDELQTSLGYLVATRLFTYQLNSTTTNRKGRKDVGQIRFFTDVEGGAVLVLPDGRA